MGFNKERIPSDSKAKVSSGDLGGNTSPATVLGAMEIDKGLENCVSPAHFLNGSKDITVNQKEKR